MANAEKDMKNSANNVTYEKSVLMSASRLRRCSPEGARLEEMLEEIENDKLIVGVQIEHRRTSRFALTGSTKKPIPGKVVTRVGKPGKIWKSALQFAADGGGGA